MRRLLEAVLRRWSTSAFADAFVLRGGLLMQHWVGHARRTTRDVDWLALESFKEVDMVPRIASILQIQANDGVDFNLATLTDRVIWQERKFPGLRLMVEAQLDGQRHPLQIDIGYGDPLIPPARWIDYACELGDATRVQAVQAELLTAWKLDGLFDHGMKRWQAKDLYDLYLLTSLWHLDQAKLTTAIETAFATHETPLAEVVQMLYRPGWWTTPTAQARWAKFAQIAGVELDLVSVGETVAEALGGAIAEIVKL